MNIRPIRNQEDLHAAAKRLESLWDAKPETPEAEEMEILAELIEAYESRTFPDLALYPIEAVKCMLEMKGLSVADLASVMPRNRAYEVLNYRRHLSINMIRGLHKLLGIPLECLVQPYALKNIPKAG